MRGSAVRKAATLIEVQRRGRELIDARLGVLISVAGAQTNWLMALTSWR